MRIAVFCDAFPELSETFVVNEIRALRRAGHEVRVVASRPARSPLALDEPALCVTYLDALPRSRKLAAAARLALTRAAATARDAADRRAWRPEEDPRRTAALAPVVHELAAWPVDHLHAHFAAGAAVDALRAGRMLARPVSVTAHAHEIFATPRNLALKLRRATFTTTGCQYNVRHLRALAGDAGRIHEVVMGIDPQEFRRSAPQPDSRRVLAVGRLVEKKGFGVLLDACARTDAVERLTIIGDGPLREVLRDQVRRLGLQARVDLAGPREPNEVRAALEQATVLAMPCVIARDGDRDSMPVVVKEALAMEVPVVASDEVGLPEIVDETCGRLVPPGDPEALAEALAALLHLSPAERAGLGRRGRERVLERADVDRETARLVALMEEARRTAGLPRS